jgi:hypothetical protein
MACASGARNRSRRLGSTRDGSSRATGARTVDWAEICGTVRAPATKSHFRSYFASTCPLRALRPLLCQLLRGSVSIADSICDELTSTNHTRRSFFVRYRTIEIDSLGKRRPPESGLNLGRKRPRRAYGDKSPPLVHKPCRTRRNGEKLKAVTKAPLRTGYLRRRYYLNVPLALALRRIIDDPPIRSRPPAQSCDFSPYLFGQAYRHRRTSPFHDRTP